MALPLTTIPLRLIGGQVVTLELPDRLTKPAWDHLLRILAAMKEGYVEEAEHGDELLARTALSEHWPMDVPDHAKVYWEAEHADPR